MAYSSWSVVLNEQPSAAKWNILGTNDASFNDGTGIAASAITPEKLLTGTGTSWTWQSWTPTWTATGGSPAIGNGTWDNKYILVGKLLIGYLRFTAGSTTNFGSGDWRFTLPVTVTAPSSSSYFWPVGTWTAAALASGGNYSGTMHIFSDSGTSKLVGFNDLPSAAAAVGTSIPAAFQNGSIFNLNFTCMAA